MLDAQRRRAVEPKRDEEADQIGVDKVRTGLTILTLASYTLRSTKQPIGAKMKTTIITGVFTVTAAILGAVLGRQTMTVSVSAVGGTQNLSVDALSAIYEETTAELERLRFENETLRSDVGIAQANDASCGNAIAERPGTACISSTTSDSSCFGNDACIQDANLAVRVHSLSSRGTSVTVSLQVRNVTGEAIQARLLPSSYAVLTSASGDRQEHVGNSARFSIAPGATHSLGYNFVLRQEPEQDVFDFLLGFTEPSSSFAFTGINAR